MKKDNKKKIVIRKEGNKVYVDELVAEILHSKKAVLKVLANR